ncbi:MAG: monothiol glutaredoxin [Cellvibrionaceae bacterium]|jgi:monothiol glutaredoxin
MDLQAKFEEIKADLTANSVLLYMKGNKDFPMCGFSAQVVSILNAVDVSYETRDILQDQELREAIKIHANWPTIPQLYINGNFVGGCDIVTELYQEGDLAPMLSSK